MKDTGSATANQDSQLGGNPSMDMRSMAKMFWGEEMGLVMPPMLDASATPMTCGWGPCACLLVLLVLVAWPVGACGFIGGPRGQPMTHDV
eukprot:1137785-Pelagomonas_calceolata.AAC.7